MKFKNIRKGMRLAQERVPAPGTVIAVGSEGWAFEYDDDASTFNHGPYVYTTDDARPFEEIDQEVTG